MAEIDHGSAKTMEKKAVPVSGPTLGSAVATAVSPAEALFRRRIDFHPARKVGVNFGGNDDFRIETLNPSNEDKLPVARVVSGKPPAPGVMGEKGVKGSDDHGLDPEISFSITFRRIGAGLANLGNTCFLNSVLQCLTYTEPFAAYLQSGRHKSSCRIPGFCALCALQKHVMSALQSSGKILTPFHLVKNLRSISRNFRNSRQEDAHEYMVNLLESIHKCCLPSGVQVESSSAYEKSLVYKIFGGRLRSQVKCTQCSYSSNKFDPFLDLSLEITKADSLCKALSHFTAVEQLDGGEKQYQCQHCKQKVRALKQLTVYKAPYVLAIHLKRFDSVISGQKIDKKVNFEPTLDLKPFISDQQEGNSVYTLYGVLVHAGWSTHSGHYYCYVRTSRGMWHFLNDNQVSQVSESVVLAQKAYILFYIRNRSSVPKRSVAIGKENSFANTSGNRCLDAFSHGLKEKIQTTLLDGRRCTSHQSLAVSKINDPHSNKTISTKASSPNNFKMNQCSSIPLNGLTLPKAAPHAQSNGHVKKELNGSLGIPASQESSDSDVQMVVVGQQMGETSTESDSSSKENSCQMMVKNLVISLSNANKENPLKNLTWSAFSTDNAIGENVIIDVTQQNQFNGHPKHVSGNLPKHEVDGVSRKAADELRPDNIEAFKGVCAQQGSDIVESFQRVHTGQNDGQIFEKKKFINSFSQAARSKHDLHEELLADTQGIHTSSVKNETIAMARKIVKHSHKKNMYFGSRHLLFASLSLRKKRKLKRNSKKCLHQKNLTKLEETFASGNQGTSTSKVVNIISMEKKSTAKKQFHSHAEKENCYNAESSSGNASQKTFAGMSDIDNNILTLKEDANHTSVRNVDTRVKNSIQSTIMRGFGGASVPKWDDEPPHPSTHEMKNTQAKGIGYVLDEWDQEYDRGKRKKVKRSRQYVTGTNPFEDIAMRNRHQKMKRFKSDRNNSANQPLRI